MNVVRLGLARRLFARALGIATLGCALIVSAPTAAQQQLKKVKIAISNPVMGVNFAWLAMPIVLGFWKAEGYDVEILAAGASLQAVQQMAAGGADFVQVNSPVIIQGNVTNNLPLRVVMTNGAMDWALAVPEESAINSIQDIKGKKIGIFSLASGGMPFLRSYLRANGIDPEKDVSIIAVGFGAPAAQALRSNQVQALMYWSTAIAGFENAGLKLRYLRDPGWKLFPDFALATLQSTIDKDPAMVEAIARGAAKATVFALENPDCVRRLHWANFPSTKPTGADDATLARWDANYLRAQLESLKTAYEVNGGKLWGNSTAVAFDRLQNFLADNKLIERKLPPETYLTNIPNFYEKINAFDREAIRGQARSCPAKS